MKRLWAWALLAVGLGALVWGGFRSVSGSEEPLAELPPVARADLPDVVLVIGCTLRRDQLTPYGAPPTVSPVLDALAAEGTRFDDLIAASSWTKASAVALLTGHHAVSVRMVEPGPSRNELVLDASVETLAERLQGLGYQTLGVTGNPNLNQAFGLAQGFQRYRDSDGRIRDQKLPGDELVDRALALVGDRDPDRPVFLQLTLVDAHTPRAADAASLRPFAGDPRELATYRAEVRRLDQAVGRLLEGLAAQGVEDPLFMLVSDHGEGLGEAPGHVGHGKVLYESLTRIPWILKGPGVARGHVVEGLASGVDLVPTVLGLLGEPAADLPGRDWSGLVRGQGARTDREYAFTDTWFYEVRRSAVFTPEHACQRDFGSLRESVPFREGCFQRQEDPAWLHPAPRPELEQVLVDWREARLAEGEAFRGGGARALLDDLLRKQLEALGYAE